MEPIRYQMKLRLYRKEKFFGPGVAELLRRMERAGSLSAASREMGMSYSKAWKITKKSEDDMGILLMKKTSGGAGGGHTELTEDGRDLLARYEAFCREAGQAVDAIFQKYFTGL